MEQLPYKREKVAEKRHTGSVRGVNGHATPIGNTSQGTMRRGSVVKVAVWPGFWRRILRLGSWLLIRAIAYAGTTLKTTHI